MKVSCNQPELLDTLHLAASVSPSRTPHAALMHVHLVATGEQGLTVSATDMSLSIMLRCDQVDVQSPGEALISADTLLSIVRQLKGCTTVSLETIGTTAHVQGQGSHFKVWGHPPGDFPELPRFDGDVDFHVLAADLADMVARTSFAASKDPGRWGSNGLRLERDGAALTAVATDGRRLAVARGACRGEQPGEQSATIPVESLGVLGKLLDTPDVEVGVKIADNRVAVVTERAMIASDLVEGNFPPWNDVIPKDSDNRATLQTDTLLAGVRQAALLTSSESKGVKLAFDRQEVLTLSSRAPELGEAEIDVEVVKYEGEPISIGLNPQFLVDALKAISEDEVTLDLTKSNKPAVLSTGPEYTYVIMPVNLE